MYVFTSPLNAVLYKTKNEHPAWSIKKIFLRYKTVKPNTVDCKCRALKKTPPTDTQPLEASSLIGKEPPPLPPPHILGQITSLFVSFTFPLYSGCDNTFLLRFRVSMKIKWDDSGWDSVMQFRGAIATEVSYTETEDLELKTLGLKSLVFT